MKYLKYILVFILALVLIFLALGYITPSVTYNCEITVEKPVGEVWAVMSDETKLPEWIKGFKRSELVSGTRNTVGAVSNVYIEENGEEMSMQETITALKPNELMAMSFAMDFMNMNYEMQLTENGNNTIVKTRTFTVGNGILQRSIISFMPDAMKSQEEENLNNLKRVIESNTKNYFPEASIELTEE